MCKILQHFIVLTCVITLIFGYNLNTLHSIIYEDAYKTMGVYSKSLYGYTTALYRGKDKPKIFIGAPKGENYAVPAKNPGVVFTCGIKQQCEYLTLDKESQDDSWTGGTMDISMNTHTIVICGFRYTTDMQTRMLGACYLSKLNEASNMRKLLPLADPNKSTMQFNTRGGQKFSVYYYQLGEAGFSAQFTNDKHSPNLILGAPGLLNWFGGSVLYSNLNSPNQIQFKVSTQRFMSHSLFGYAVSSGRYAGAYPELYASSSPKEKDYLGAVVLFHFGRNNDSAIDNKYMLYGRQIGEAFGTSLASGDINNDGFDDLVIGAPCYTETGFNDGRIHVYYGGQYFPSKENAECIKGSNDGGQFGLAVTFLGDLNLDGYGDIAVGEPYSNNKRGKVFIYHGGPYGLSDTPAQILLAEEIDLHLRGFGISISKGVDIDGNGYPDISIGAHISGHAVILRTNPIVEIDSQLTIINGTKINVNGSTTLRLCYTHSGNPYMPKHISMRRKIVIDPNYRRVSLAPSNVEVKEFVLKNDCELFVLTTKEQLYYLREPVKFSVSYELLGEDKRRSNFYVGLNNTDTFCKTCPILLNVRPFETEFSFALGCGDDDVCTSNLSYDVKFLDLEDNTYIIGSMDVIRMEVLISNSGDSEYLTQLSITLPKHVRFNAIPKKCTEDEEGTLLCVVGNPLNTQVYLPVYLNMKDVRTTYGPNLTIHANISTSSNNKNPETAKNYTLQLKNVVDLLLTGKAEPKLLFYTTNATFKQIYQIQKIGHTQADEVAITINLPTHIIKNNESFSVVKFYSVQGSIQGRDIFCQNLSPVDYIRDTSGLTPELEAEAADVAAIIRRKKSIDSDIVYTNNLNLTVEEPPETNSTEVLISELVSKKTLKLDCRDDFSNVQCTQFTCEIGTIKSESDIAIVRIHALLDVTELKKRVKFENSIIINSCAHIDAAFDIDPISNNDADITSTFLDSKEVRIDMWILLGATCIGILLLIILTIILYKCGFFTRSKKLQLEEEKKMAATEEFENAQLSGEPCMNDECDDQQQSNDQEKEDQSMMDDEPKIDVRVQESNL